MAGAVVRRRCVGRGRGDTRSILEADISIPSACSNIHISNQPRVHVAALKGLSPTRSFRSEDPMSGTNIRRKVAQSVQKLSYIIDTYIYSSFIRII